MNLSLIVAMDRNGLIGKRGGLPWPRINEDMQMFRRLTVGQAVVMGRKTYDGIGRLPFRHNAVLARRTGYWAQSVWFASDPVNAMLHVPYDPATHTVFIIGSAQVYHAFRDTCTSAHVTLIDGEFEGDTYFPFPVLDSPDWEPAAESVTLAPGVVYHHMRRR